MRSEVSSELRGTLAGASPEDEDEETAAVSRVCLRFLLLLC